MKTAIHPTYHESVTVTCLCGNSFETGSTAETLAVEICSACHPFYTGKSKLVDTAGRVDRFQQRLQESAAVQEARATQAQRGKKARGKKSSKKSGQKVVKLS